MLKLDTDNSPLRWVPSVVSLVVTVGFFGILLIMLSPYVKEASSNQLINITVGALVAAFSTVVNFWLGSSQGSRAKDDANFQLQTQQAAQNDAARKAQLELNKDMLKNASTDKTADKTAHPVVAGGATPSGVVNGKADNFEACLDITLVQEGGYCNDAGDHGGATNYGIAHETLAEWRDCPVTIADVKELTKDEAREIYRANYWIPTRCADLPKGVDLEVFDFAVNSGVRRSLRRLQQVTGVHDDSSLGPVTLAGIKAKEPKELIAKLASDRLEFLRSLGDDQFKRFGKGWTKRVDEVQQAALKMAG
ncbi:MAG: glycoside hydrolase family 108 protein [Candidatus Acidiferrales bacterium]